MPLTKAAINCPCLAAAVRDPSTATRHHASICTTENPTPVSYTHLCHGTVDKRATLVSSGAAAPLGGSHLDALRTPWSNRRFEWAGGKLYQRSMVEAGKEWEVVQVLDTITPGNPHYSEKSRWAKTIRADGKTWGDVPADASQLAHANSRMTCYACHTSWTPNCFGCHLSMTANQKKPMLHNEGLTTRNYTAYDFQVLRDDGFMPVSYTHLFD